MVLSAFSANAISPETSLTGNDQDYIYESGELDNFTLLTVDRVNSFTAGSIYAPNGSLRIYDGYIEGFKVPDDPDFSNYDYEIGEIWKVTDISINGDVTVKNLKATAIGEIRGNVNVVGGRLTYEQIFDETTDNSNLPGTFFTGGSYHLGGFRVTGDINASLLRVEDHQQAYIPPEYYEMGRSVGALIVNGDVNIDWLLVDTASPKRSDYDNFAEYLEVHGNVHVAEDVYSGGAITIDGKLTVDGTLYNAFGEYIYIPELGATEGRVEGLQPPDYVATTATELDAKNIQNASNLFVGTLTNDREQTYTQTYGTIRVKDNWFRDSVINMSGGYINEDSLGPDKNLGINNTFNVTGGTLIVGDLNFDSTVNLSQDGKIQTDIESIFINPDGDPEALNYVSMNASQPESVKASLTKWFTNYVAGTLRTDLEDHVNFNGGSIVVSGFGKITETQYDDLMDAFKEAFLYPVYPSFSIDNSQIQRGHFTFKNWGVEEF